MDKNSEKIAKEFIPKGTPYFIKNNNDGISFMIGGTARTTELGNIKSETQDYVKIDINLGQSTGAVASANYFDKAKINEAMDDLEAPLPSQLTRFLQKTISIIKGYNLSRKKEALVMAKVIDAMGIDKSELNQIMSRVRKAGVLNKEGNINEDNVSSYFTQWDSPTKSAAKKIDDALGKLIKDKKELNKLAELITDLADEYAEERIDAYQQDMIDRY